MVTMILIILEVTFSLLQKVLSRVPKTLLALLHGKFLRRSCINGGMLEISVDWGFIYQKRNEISSFIWKSSGISFFISSDKWIVRKYSCIWDSLAGKMAHSFLCLEEFWHKVSFVWMKFGITFCLSKRFMVNKFLHSVEFWHMIVRKNSGICVSLPGKK